MTRIEFELPDVGEGVAEGVLLEWHAEPGDSVTEDQVVAQVETDKAVVDVPSPVDGTVAERHAEAGDVVPVGDVLVVFETDDDGGEAGSADGKAQTDDSTASGAGGTGDTGTASAGSNNGSQSGQTFAPPSVRRLARELDVDLEAIDGSGPSGRLTEMDVRRAAQGGDETATTGAATDPDNAGSGGAETVEVAASGAGAETVPREDGASAMAPADRDETLAMPAARTLAHELGVDIDDVPASRQVGDGALVTERDVREYAGAASGGETGSRTTAGATEGAPATGAEETGVAERVPYRGIRRTIGEQMKRAKFTAPHATHHEAVDVTDLVDVRDELGEVAEERGINLSFTPFFLKAVVAGLREYPVLNSRLDEEAEEIVCYDEYNVGVAVDTPHGLVVPVIDDVDEKSVADLATELEDLVRRAQDRSLDRSEMQGGTFTISNAGNLGGEFATPIINYPEAAILGFAAIRKRPWVVDDEVVPRHVLPLSLSFDHRVVDGATAARFVNDVMDYLREPRRLLLE